MGKNVRLSSVDNRLVGRARTIWTNVSCVTADERLLVLTDDQATVLGSAFYQGARDRGCQVIHVIMPPLVKGAPEPLALAGLALRECDVYVAITSASSRSISHCQARQEA